MQVHIMAMLFAVANHPTCLKNDTFLVADYTSKIKEVPLTQNLVLSANCIGCYREKIPL